MKFGRYLKEHMHPPWAQHMIDYAGLKRVVYATEHAQSADGGRVRASEAETEAFMERLDGEIERVSAFYTRMAAELRLQLSQLQAEQQSSGASEAMIEALREVGRTAVLLVQFLELNLTGLRKILKKHEKRIRGQPVAARYLASRRDKESALQRLHNHTELDEIYDAVREAINLARTDLEMHELLEPAPEGESAASQSADELPAAGPYPSLTSPASRGGLGTCSPAREKGSAASNGLGSEARSTPGRTPASMRRQSSIYAHEPVLREMADRLRELDHASRFVNTLLVSLAETSGITSEEGQGMNKSDSKLALGLNLLSTFIFMVNYYVVLPSSSAYCSELGAPPSFSGVAVGILPAAACLAAVVYSYATQFSYRLPLMASALLCCAGNLVYALALPSGSLAMLLAGRVLVGMGGARVVNRRYIADHVDLEYRTEASAAFVAFTALGMAVGPGVAACISALPEGEVAGLPLNNMTTPGYAMLLLWLPYFLVVACAFVEPPMHARQGALARARVKGNGPEASQPLLPRADSPAQRELQPHQPRRPPQYGAPSPLGRAPSPADGGARAAALKHQQQRLGSTSAWSEEQGESGQNANQMPLLEEELRAGDGRASDRAGAAAIASPAAAAAASPGKLRARLASLGAASKFGEGDSRPLLTIEGSARGRASGSQLLGVGVLLWLYLVDKLLAEAWLTSAPIVTRSVFGWGEQRVGIFLCTVCALVLPASQVATLLFAGVSAHTRERTIISVMMCALLAGGGMLLCYLPPYTGTQAHAGMYVCGAAIFFLANNLLEAATMSLLSKKMPKAWAAGILNSGFLTTLTGLGGRVLGNLLVSLLGSLVSTHEMNDSLLVPLYVLWGLTMALFFCSYGRFVAAP